MRVRITAGVSHSWTDGSQPASLSRAQSLSPERKHVEKRAYLSGDHNFHCSRSRLETGWKRLAGASPCSHRKRAEERGCGGWRGCEDDENQAANEEIPKAAQRLPPPPRPGAPSIPALPLPSLQSHSFLLYCALPARLHRHSAVSQQPPPPCILSGLTQAGR